MNNGKQIAREFLSYIDSVHEDVPIDHNSWHSCAVGIFSSQSGHGLDSVKEACKEIKVDAYVIEEDMEICSLNDFLGECSLSYIQNRCPTYGDLQDFIEINVDMSSLED